MSAFIAPLYKIKGGKTKQKQKEKTRKKLAFVYETHRSIAEASTKHTITNPKALKPLRLSALIA